MKIIKMGIMDRLSEMRVVCKSCEAELEIIADDVIKDDVRRYYITCPCCNSMILIYEGQIPKNMLNKIDYRETI